MTSERKKQYMMESDRLLDLGEAGLISREEALIVQRRLDRDYKMNGVRIFLALLPKVQVECVSE